MNMITTLFIVLTSLILIPNDKLSKVFNQTLKVWEGLKLKSETYRGKIFLRILNKQISQLKVGVLKQFEWIDYKNFQVLVEDLLKTHRDYGGPIIENLINLREAINLELKNDEEIRKIRNGSRFQMGLITLIVWCFLIYALSIFKIQLSYIDYLPIVVLQCLGLLVESVSMSKLLKRHLVPLRQCSSSFTNFSQLVQANLAVDKALQKSNLTHNLENLPKKFSYINVDFEFFYMDWKTNGSSIVENMNLISTEFNYQIEASFKDYIKLGTALQLIIIALFFFPTYFYIILIIMRNVSLA